MQQCRYKIHLTFDRDSNNWLSNTLHLSSFKYCIINKAKKRKRRKSIFIGKTNTAALSYTYIVHIQIILHTGQSIGLRIVRAYTYVINLVATNKALQITNTR